MNPDWRENQPKLGEVLRECSLVYVKRARIPWSEGTRKHERRADLDFKTAGTVGERLEKIAQECLMYEITFHEFERFWRRTVLRTALVAHNWNQIKTADALGIHRNTVNHLMDEYGLRREMK